MFFLIQKEKDYFSLDIDLLVLKDELDKQKYTNEYTYMTLDELKHSSNFPDKYSMKDAVPIGSLDFVSAYLSRFHNITYMTPIEVPNKLRIDDYLCRRYSIIDKYELKTKSGYWFTKAAYKLKAFSHMGLVEQLLYEDVGKEPFLKDGLYVFSEVKTILAEYRVFVCDDEITGIQFYDGEPTIMPTIDEIKKIKTMVLRYMLDNTRPNAYSLDVAIIKSDNEIGRDLMVIECHPFTSLGLYGLNGSFLPRAYRHGIDWYIKHNTPLTKFSNFETFEK